MKANSVTSGEGEEVYSQLGTRQDGPDICTSPAKLIRLTSFLLWPRGSALAHWLPSPTASFSAPAHYQVSLAAQLMLDMWPTYGRHADKPTCFDFADGALVIWPGCWLMAARSRMLRRAARPQIHPTADVRAHFTRCRRSLYSMGSARMLRDKHASNFR